MFVGSKNHGVGLLNNGTEASKGDPLRKETYQLLSEDESIHLLEMWKRVIDGWRC